VTFPSAIQQCLDHNKKASLKKCNHILEQSLREIKSKLSREQGNSVQQSLSTIESELQNTLINPYCRSDLSLGPCSVQAFLEFMEIHLVEDLYKPLLKDQIERQIRKQEEEN